MSENENAFAIELAAELNKEAEKSLAANESSIIHGFLCQYYSQISSNEFSHVSFGDLYGASLAHWQLARTKQPSKPNVHIYNPDYERHGWQSTHTVLEIVCDDMPFLVDSVSMALNRSGLTIHHTLHPVLPVSRDKSGTIVKVHLADENKSESAMESFMQFHFDRETSEAALNTLQQTIETTLNDVALACKDWQAMRESVKSFTVELYAESNNNPRSTLKEAAELLEWIENDHFTLTGLCEFSSASDPTTRTRPILNKKSVLGILQKPSFSDDHIEKLVLPCSMMDFLEFPDDLVLTKSSADSTIHRPARLDLICIKANNQATGQVRVFCVLGLFTSAAYNRNTREIPHIQHKVGRLMSATNLPANGHLGKVLRNIIEIYPRDTLFQIPESQLKLILNGIMHLQERQHIRMFVATEPFNRFHSVLVYIPKDRFHSDLRLRIQNMLRMSFNSLHVEFNVLFTESVLARIHFLVYTDTATKPDIDLTELERRIADAALTWNDHLRTTLVEQFGEESGIRYFNQYRNAFPISYQDDCNPRRAAYDIQRINLAATSGELGTYFYRPVNVIDGSVHLRLYSREAEVSLSEVIPMIENMGLRVLGERPYLVTPAEGAAVWLHEFSLTNQMNWEIDAESSREVFEDAFTQIWKGNLEDDGFNRLVLGAGLSWRECMVIRAYAKFMKQIRIRYSQDYIEDTLSSNPHMTRRLIALFHILFDPEFSLDRETARQNLMEQINEGMERVVNLDEDRILTASLNAIEATLRTNFYQCDSNGNHKEYLSIKFDPSQILRMPEPRPMFEIFVYSPWVEAVHLRGGKVARGGLRWSDRPEDFRTEVLGLVKAQMVKNAVIVPVGSKGGFIVKRMPDGERDVQMAEVIRCYQSFMRGMLDITDNIVGDSIVHPEQTVRRDEDDPYLVVAADKGTATFSDIANGIAKEYNFWLGDAFASGGSDGYDHKKMAITARGAWESVKRHFREIGVDTQTQPFTVIGIGDMGGDVFGNGMLLSNQIRLLAAFNHLHIFIDPDADPTISFAERQRLFDLPRSSWKDYDASLISSGGGIYNRTDKSIELSAEARQALGINQDSITPTDLINRLLKSSVDLVWNGGIGTYVKSTSETHDDVIDRANDPLRVNGNELRCKVFGEGGNLGMTQLGRIEYSEKGGLCYSDAIDNSAGVDTSDHEVNIKILLDRSVGSGDLTVKQRNQMLASMTDNVADLVLRDNYEQTQAISLAATTASELFRQHIRFIRHLEREGELNRELEYLPNEEMINHRIKVNLGLSRPELSVLFAYSKITLYKYLIETDVPEDQYLSFTLARYFPGLVSEKLHDVMMEHPLRREIIVTHITNDMVNRGGPTFAFRLWELTGVSWSHIARAYTVATEIFNLRRLWSEIEGLDNQVADAVQKSMLQDVAGLVERATSWLIRNRPENMNISATVDYFQGGVSQLVESYPRSLAASNRLIHKKRAKQLQGLKVGTDLAHQVASLMALSSALDIVDVSQRLGCDVGLVANIYYGLGDALEIHWLRDQVGGLKIRNHWQAMAVFSLRNEFHSEQKELTALVLGAEQTGNGRKMLRKWLAQNETYVSRFLQLIADFKAVREIDFAMLSVAISQIKTMHGGV
ncbi:MAG: glutamate dehydrogenase [Parasphingorhabdus sp.]|jgi:glutamate dehydrogenase